MSLEYTLRDDLMWSDGDMVRASDVVIVTSGVVGRVVRFWHQSNSEPVVHLHKLDGEEYWSMNAPVARFVRVDDIVDALPWAYNRVVLPVVLQQST